MSSTVLLKPSLPPLPPLPSLPTGFQSEEDVNVTRPATTGLEWNCGSHGEWCNELYCIVLWCTHTLLEGKSIGRHGDGCPADANLRDLLRSFDHLHETCTCAFMMSWRGLDRHAQIIMAAEKRGWVLICERARMILLQPCDGATQGQESNHSVRQNRYGMQVWPPRATVHANYISRVCSALNDAKIASSVITSHGGSGVSSYDMLSASMFRVADHRMLCIVSRYIATKTFVIA